MFVTLAVLTDIITPESQPYVLNLLGMWMACVLQTMKPVDLEKYLPAIPMPWAGFHLNVVPPIWQRFPSEANDIAAQNFTREDFERLLFSDDPCQRQYAKELRESYNNLLDSPDTRLRQYYRDNQRRASVLGIEERQRKKYTTYQHLLDVGAEYRVNESKGTLQLHLHDYVFIINRLLKAPVKNGDMVHIQLFLLDAPSPLRYCQKALHSDPSSRLLILMRNSHDFKGIEFSRWLFSHGDEVPQRMNTLVDTLKGLRYKESIQRPRRI